MEADAEMLPVEDLTAIFEERRLLYRMEPKDRPMVGSAPAGAKEFKAEYKKGKMLTLLGRIKVLHLLVVQ